MIKNLSVSKIEAYQLCPLSVKYSYLDKIPQVSPGTLLVGRVIHDIVEAAIKEYGRTQKYPDRKTLDDRFEPTYKRLVAKEESRDTFIGWQWDTPEADAKAAYRALVPVAREAIEKVRPWMLDSGPAAEQRIDLEFDTEVGVAPLIGYVDLLEENGLLCDWKSTLQKKPSARAKSTWLQFACYSFWSWPLVGEEEQHCQKIFLVAGGTPHAEFVPFTVGPKHREWFAKVAAQVWKAIHYGVYPGNNTTWKCSSAFCSYHGPCQDGISKEPSKSEAVEVAAQAVVEESW